MSNTKKAANKTDEDGVKVPKRKKQRKVRIVTFTLEGWDEPFVLPDINRLTQRQQWALQTGDITQLRERLLGDYTEAIEEMEDDEVTAFIAAWQAESDVEPGESDAA